jgi:hypothetical protein
LAVTSKNSASTASGIPWRPYLLRPGPPGRASGGGKVEENPSGDPAKGSAPMPRAPEESMARPLAEIGKPLRLRHPSSPYLRRCSLPSPRRYWSPMRGFRAC